MQLIFINLRWYIIQYTNWKNPEDGYVNQALLSEAIGDGRFICPHRRWADSWSQHGLKVYYFHLTDVSVNT